MTAVAALQYHRLRAPREDGRSLVVPPLGDVAALLSAHERRRAATPYADYDVQGRPLGELSAAARAALTRDALAYTRTYRDVRVPAGPRVLLAGHQPQLFHPGVWLKNFVLSHLGAAHDAVPINLLIDSDTVKSAAVAVPGGSPADPIVEHVPLDAPTAAVAYEERSIVDRELLNSFGRRAGEHLGALVRDSLLAEYWPLVTRRADAVSQLGLCVAQGRHQLEGSRGYHTLELPFSRVCEAEPFAWFVAHLLAHLPRLWQVYNDSLAEYRRNHRLRSASHPVPNLAAEGGWLEAPFWIWRSDDPRRRAVFARAVGSEIHLSDRAGFELRLPLSTDGDGSAAAGLLHALPRRGIKLRTRALTTTLWARLALGDLFIHGLGGAKYDQLTDALIERFLGLAPPAFLTVSGTLYLPVSWDGFPARATGRTLAPPVERPAATEEDLRLLDRKLRALRFGPERFIDVEQAPPGDRETLRELIAAKQTWIARQPAVGQTTTVPDGLEAYPTPRQRFVELRRLSEALRPWIEGERQRVIAQRQTLEHQLRAARVLGSREYPFCFYPWEKMRILLLEFPPLTS
jgi:hypothetical protein